MIGKNADQGGGGGEQTRSSFKGILVRVKIWTSEKTNENQIQTPKIKMTQNSNFHGFGASWLDLGYSLSLGLIIEGFLGLFHS